MEKKRIQIFKFILIFLLLLSMVVPENCICVFAENETETFYTETAEETINSEQNDATEPETEVTTQDESGQETEVTTQDEPGQETEVTTQDEPGQETEATAQNESVSKTEVTTQDEPELETGAASETGEGQEIAFEDVSETVVTEDSADELENLKQGIIAASGDGVSSETDRIITSEQCDGTLTYDSTEEIELEGWGEIAEEDQLLFASYSSIPKGIWISGTKDATYTGEEITFDGLRVYDENIMLVEGEDYEVSYENNTNAAAEDSTKPPLILITGLGNYKGQIQARFTIKPMTMLSTGIEIADVYMKYTGEIIYPLVEVIHNSKKLENKKDYIFDVRTTKNILKDAVDAGTYNILITGVGNYTGTRTIKLYVTKGTMIEEVEFTPIEPQSYTGKAIKPDLVMTYEGRQLKPGADYSVQYKNNKEAGIATVIITGKGDFAGVREETFEITGISMLDTDIYDLQESYYYTGSAIKPTLRIYYSRGSSDVALSTLLKLNTDYQVTYENNKEVGLATITIKGKGKYCGTIVQNFEIIQYDFNSEDGNLRISSEPVVPFVKGGCKPEVKVLYYGNALKEGRDYTLKYTNISEAGNTEKQPTITITGIGNYTGVLTRNFVINAQDITKLEVYAPDKVYSRNKEKSYHVTFPTVYDLDGSTLKRGVDYKTTGYQYKNRTVLEDSTIRLAGDPVKALDRMPIGTVLMVNIQGIGNYQGYTSASYKIVTQDMSKAKVTVNVESFTGSEITPGKNQLTVKLGSRILRNTDYEIVTYYDNVNEGTAKVLIHGTGNYGGYATGKFIIKVRDIKGNGVYFNGNGATGGKMSDIRLSSLETDAVLYPSAYVRKGYEFNGWNTKEDGSGMPYQDCGTITFPADKNGIMITLYAQWQPNAYNITYHLNGGTNNGKNPSFYRYNTESVVFQAPTRDGYDFKGWYRTRNFAKLTPEIKPGTMGNITLYAKWKVKAPIIASITKTASGYNRVIYSQVVGAAKYVIYRSTEPNGKYERIGASTSTSYVDEKVKSGKIYYYKVRAYSKERTSRGYSDYSNELGIGGN